MQNPSFAVSATLFVLITTAPAFAQVTPEQVWQNWQKMGASYGQAIIADQVTRMGDTLVVSKMQISMDQPDAKISGGIDEVRFRDLGDGTVEVTMTDTYGIDLTMTGENGAAQQIAVVLKQPGVKLIAGGDATKTSYRYDLPTMTIDLQIRENGATLADIDSTITNIRGTYEISDLNSRTLLSSAMDIDRLAFNLVAGDATEGATVTGSLDRLGMSTNGNFLGIAAMENMAQALRDGFAASTDFSYGAGDFVLNVTESGKQTKIAAKNDSGKFTFALADGALRYGAGGTGVAMTLSGGDIPFPEIKINYGEASFDFLMPMLASAGPVDFTFLTRIVDLTVSDEIWAMFDPTATLPRDPATLIIDTKGKAKLTTDLADEAAMAALGTAPPGEVHALDLTELAVKFGGVSVSGSGAMTFDNSDLVTFDGIPAPTGRVDLVIAGANSLIDKLVTMGMIPQEEAMGTRMMIAMLAKPGAEPDVLTSTLEFRDKGFFANGQRLK